MSFFQATQDVIKAQPCTFKVLLSKINPQQTQLYIVCIVALGNQHLNEPLSLLPVRVNALFKYDIHNTIL